MSNKVSGNSEVKKQAKKLKNFLPFKLNESQKQMKVTNLQVDSRKVQPGDLFIAYPGTLVDGRQFAAKAAESGAICILAEKATSDDERQWLQNLNSELIEVEGLQSQLGYIAANFFDAPSEQLDLIAVTGTNGKTSVTQLLAQALQCLNKKPAVMGTLGNGPLDALATTANTTPGATDVQALLREFVDTGVDTIALEASSHGLEQGRLTGTKIDTAVVTNISRDHLDYHGTMEAYQQSKEILVQWPELKNLVLNMDDENVVAMAKNVDKGVKRLSFSEQDSSADVFASDIEYSREGLRFQIHYRGDKVSIETSLLGGFNVSNLLAVCGVLLLRKYKLRQIADVFAQLEPIKGRMEIISLKGEKAELPVVVVDYAHTPDALDQALRAMRYHCDGALWCVFGCGGDRDKGKRPLMGKVVSELADKVVLTTDNPRTEKAEAIFKNIEDGFGEATDYFVEKDRKLAIYDAISQAVVNDCILLAGKGHEDYQEINGVKHLFSDIKSAKKALKKRLQGSEPSCI